MDNLALPVPVGTVGGRGGYIMAALVKTLQAIMNMGNLALLSEKKAVFGVFFFRGGGWGPSQKFFNYSTSQNYKEHCMRDLVYIL